MSKKKEIIVKLPDGIAMHRKVRTVSIDVEIVRTIKYLWKNSIQTLGCCSGHRKEKPSLVIAEGYNDKDIKRIEKLISKISNKEWDILQWKIKKVN